MMGMTLFYAAFQDIARAETRTVTLLEPRGQPDELAYLPANEYGFVELYCDERGCDCRRVMINVMGRNGTDHVATINHAFERPSRGDVVEEQTFLDPLNPQGPYAAGAMALFETVVLADPAYRARLERHYAMFKRVVDDVAHPLHRVLRGGSSDPIDDKRIIPPPPRRGKKRRRW